MALPVFNTFIEFRVERETRRYRSAPPGLHVQVALADASPRRRRRRRNTQTDDEVFAEYRQRNRWEAWATLARRVLQNHRDKVKAEILLNRLEAAARRLEPRLQVKLPTRVFINVAHCLRIYHVAFAMFVRQRVLRPNADNMEIWLSQNDLKSENMKTLVSHAKDFRLSFSRGEFVIRLPLGANSACTSAMRLDEHMTVDGLKGIASASTGIPSRRLRMTHLGSDLVSGRLVDSGVSPGSCIIVSEIIEC